MWLTVWGLSAVLLIGCANSLAAPTTLQKSELPLALRPEMANAQPICAPRAPLAVEFERIVQLQPHVLVALTRDARTTIMSVGADGEAIPLDSPRSLANIQLSANGGTLTYEVITGTLSTENAVEVHELDTGRGWRVTPGEGCAIFGFALDAQGQRFASLQVAMRGRFKPAPWQIVIADLKQETVSVLRGESETALAPLAWSGDTLLLHAFVPYQASGQQGVWQAQADGSNLRLILQESEFVSRPLLAQDGQWLAYLASDVERLPREYVAGAGEPPANRIAALNLKSGERRTLAETPQSFGALAGSRARLLFTNGNWGDSHFHYDQVSSIQVERPIPQALVAVAAGESIGDVQSCGADWVVASIRHESGDVLRWWKNDSVKTFDLQPNAELRILGCGK